MRSQFETAERLVESLARLGLIRRDPLIAAFLEGTASAVSLRTIQRRFIETTGLSPYSLMQVRRAERTAELLQKEAPLSPLSRVATEVGYVDQSHMTRAARRFLGYTPSQFRSASADYVQTCR